MACGFRNSGCAKSTTLCNIFNPEINHYFANASTICEKHEDQLNNVLQLPMTLEESKEF
jgi:hypothetical protein